MYRYKHRLVTLGAVILMVLFGSMLTGQKVVTASPLNYDFTYTFTDTAKTVPTCDSFITFQSLLTNTGSQADTYYVTRTKILPFPPSWTVRFCVGGICYEPNVTVAKTFLEQGENAQILLDVIPLTPGEGKNKIVVHSKFNPTDSDSLTFRLTAYPRGPVTNQWGLIILFLLILASGMYLMFRRLRVVKQP